MKKKTTAITVKKNSSNRRYHSVAVLSAVKRAGVVQPMNNLILYRLVFATRSVAIATLMLMMVFLLQPLHHVFADEVTPTTVESDEEVPLFADAVIDSQVEEESEVNEQRIEVDVDEFELSNESNIKAEQSTDVQASDSTVMSSSTEETKTEVPQDDFLTSTEEETTREDEFTSSTSSDAEEVSDTTLDDIVVAASSTDGATISPEDELVQASEVEIDSPTEEAPIEKTPDIPKAPTFENPEIAMEEPATDNQADATTTPDEYEEVGVPTPTFYHVGGNDSELVFLEQQCTKVGDSSFYCQKQAPLSEVQDTLTALPDADGDLEIFLVRDGQYAQITQNRVDDSAPFYDPSSESLVWQRLIGEYYQVVAYDIESGEESQLTSGDTNNMEPKRDGKYTTWQRWVDGYWQIVVSNGNAERQITDAPVHNMAPHIRGHLVIWSVHHSNGHRELQTYDMKTDTYTTIGDNDDISVINPRLMMVYEAVYSNGDSIMRGYDMLTGAVVPLQALPRQLPDEIPDTDTTGETRALIQNKPSLKEAEVETDPSTPTTLPPEPPPATTTDSYTLEISTTTAPTTEPAPIFTATEFDLHIPPLNFELSAEESLTTPTTSSSTQTESE